MSEFTYACPVCHQHLKCEAANGGSVVKCPTCFQRIVAPQAPENPDSRMVLMGLKYVAQKSSAEAVPANAAPARSKAVPRAAIITVVLILIALGGVAAVVFFTTGRNRSPGATMGAASWQTADLGNVFPPGSFSQSSEEMTLQGSGADIWGKADELRYAFHPLAGDFTLTARLTSMDNVASGSKAGLMIRESSEPDAPNVLVGLMPKTGVFFQQRQTRGGNTVMIHLTGDHTARWLRLTRQGDSLTAYESEDGKIWSPVGVTTVAMASATQAGLVVCSRRPGILCGAHFDHVGIKLDSKTKPVPAPAMEPSIAKTAAPEAAATGDTHWTDNLTGVAIAQGPVGGRIHGKYFALHHAEWADGKLSFRSQKGAFKFGAVVDFRGAAAESLVGKAIDISTGTKRAATVTLLWPDDHQQPMTDEFTGGYAMRLEFDKLISNSNSKAGPYLSGAIYLCTPDHAKSYLTGRFKAFLADNSGNPK